MCAKTRWAARASCATTSDDWHRLLNAVLSAVACGALGLGAVGPRGAIIGAVALCLALLAHVIVTVVRGGDLYSCIAFGGDIDPASARRVPRRIGLPNRSALNEPDGAPTRTRSSALSAVIAKVTSRCPKASLTALTTASTETPSINSVRPPRSTWTATARCVLTVEPIRLGGIRSENTSGRNDDQLPQPHLAGSRADTRDTESTRCLRDVETSALASVVSRTHRLRECVSLGMLDEEREGSVYRNVPSSQVSSNITRPTDIQSRRYRRSCIRPDTAQLSEGVTFWGEGSCSRGTE